MNVGIAGTGYYLPERVLTNKELGQYADVTDDWIQKKIGLRSGELRQRMSACQIWHIQQHYKH